MTDWQPIDGADKEAERLILGRPHPNGWVAVGHFGRAQERWLDDQGRRFVQQPTHFQPWPEVPK